MTQLKSVIKGESQEYVEMEICTNILLWEPEEDIPESRYIINSFGYDVAPRDCVHETILFCKYWRVEEGLFYCKLVEITVPGVRLRKGVGVNGEYELLYEAKEMIGRYIRNFHIPGWEFGGFVEEMMDGWGISYRKGVCCVGGSLSYRPI